MDEYFINYDNFNQIVIYKFDLGMGGIGDLLKFFTYMLNYCIIHNIKLYLLSNNNINNYIKLKFNKIYINQYEFDNINKQYINTFDELINIKDIAFIVRPHILHHINIYDTINSLNSIFYFTDDVILNANNIIKNNDKYISIHLRLGDCFLETDKIHIQYPQDIRVFDEIKLFNFIENNSHKNIIFFCDNNSYKLKLKQQFDFINITDLSIGHTSHSNTTELQYLNSCIEFYILTKSEEIYKASQSGFSIMASKFENIPIKNI